MDKHWKNRIGYVMKPASHIGCRASLLDGVSYGDRLLHVFLVEQRVIDAQDDPVKQGTVERFGHGVSGSDGLIEGRRHDEKIKPKLSMDSSEGRFPMLINSGN